MSIEQVNLPETITSVTGLVTAVGVIVMYLAGKRREKKQEIIAQSNERALQGIHKLVNGNHTHVLKQNAIATQQLATITGDPGHAQSAQEAHDLLVEHLRAEAAEQESERLRLEAEAAGAAKTKKILT